MYIELKYFNPNTGRTSHFFFRETEEDLALDYYNDAIMCGCAISIWRLVRDSYINIK